MENKIQNFDPSTLMQGVRDRIKATFVSLIPDAQWEELVKVEIDNFFKSKDNYQSRENRSNFKDVVLSELEVITRTKVAEVLREKYVSTVWENGSLKVSEELEKIIVEKSPEIIGKVMGSFFQQAINTIQYNYNR